MPRLSKNIIRSADDLSKDHHQPTNSGLNIVTVLKYGSKLMPEEIGEPVISVMLYKASLSQITKVVLLAIAGLVCSNQKFKSTNLLKTNLVH